MNDRMIRELAAHGGVMNINYFNGFLSQPFSSALGANDGRIEKDLDAVVLERCGANGACRTLAFAQLYREQMDAGSLPRVEWTEIVDHIAYAAELTGTAHVGLGSDFDGAEMPYGMEDVTGLPKLTAEMLRRGYTPEQVRGMLGENMLRLMENVEAVAARHRSGSAQNVNRQNEPTGGVEEEQHCKDG
jgi:membrane dipeptidase